MSGWDDYWAAQQADIKCRKRLADENYCAVICPKERAEAAKRGHDPDECQLNGGCPLKSHPQATP